VKLAVIDIGTNSVHMLMAQIYPNSTFEVIGREREMIRLGDRTLSTGYLQKEQMELGLETLKKFKYLAQSKGIERIKSVATSAVREAQNGGDFLERVYKQTGIRVRVITGEEEGRLIYQGVRHSVTLSEGPSLIIDIGGGSVELMVVNPEEILFLTSLKLGAARVYERFIKKGRKKEFTKMEAYIRQELADSLGPIMDIGFQKVIGTSAMAFYRGHGAEVSLQPQAMLQAGELQDLYQDLKNSGVEERLEMKGLDPRRSDIILGGAAVAWVLAKELKIRELMVCDKALREGMIYSYIQKNRRKIRSEAEIPDVRRRSILKLAHKCQYQREHAHQTAKLALMIFDKAQPYHRLASLDRELLEYAALLHDIGYYISFERHHHHTYYLIKNVALDGFTPEEIEIIALVSRYHRRILPKKNQMGYRELSKGARRRVKWMAAILRIADALDRSHFSVVEGVRLRRSDKRLLFQIEATNDAEYELWETRQKAELFEDLLGLTLDIRVKRIPKRRALRVKTHRVRPGRLRMVP
jgi:exopolyphosphatase/guanosine-5'-triphosphate,3'-diphosphate pyrophosphatase